jgi:S-adenosylmethionine:tRNA ribosyltransferase-isomerase
MTEIISPFKITSRDGKTAAGSKWADLFIYGGYKFKAADALITNFHFPDSTPLCMACAFAGEDFIYAMT